MKGRIKYILTAVVATILFGMLSFRATGLLQEKKTAAGELSLYQTTDRAVETAGRIMYPWDIGKKDGRIALTDAEIAAQGKTGSKSESEKGKNEESTDMDINQEDGQGVTQNEQKKSQAVDDASATATPEPEKIEITVSAAGDCTFACDESLVGSNDFNHVYEAQGAAYFFREVKSVFAKDDLTIVNLEGTLTEQGTRQDKTWAFRGSPEYVKILQEGSVEAVSFANNHCQDYGEISYQDTMKYLDEADVIYSSYEKIAVVEKKGIRIGLISVSWTEDTEATLRSAIKKLKKEKTDLQIVSMHCGIERDALPDEQQKSLARIAIDEGGADLVLGHHPHVLQGVEKYKDAYIIYSLGNFSFGGNTNPDDKDTMIFQQKFTFIDGALQQDDAVQVIPCRLSSTTEYNDYQPVVLEGDAKKRVIQKINERSEGFEISFKKSGKVKKES